MVSFDFASSSKLLLRFVAVAPRSSRHTMLFPFWVTDLTRISTLPQVSSGALLRTPGNWEIISDLNSLLGKPIRNNSVYICWAKILSHQMGAFISMLRARYPLSFCKLHFPAVSEGGD